jgi:aspartokinase
VLTCDPNIYANAIPVPYLTFDEAAELAYFGAQVILSDSFLSEKMLVIAPQILVVVVVLHLKS